MPGQFINSGNNPGGKVSLVNSNNSGNFNFSIAPPAFYTYQGFYNGISSTLYSSASPLDIASTLYTDSALTTPYTFGGFISGSYFFFINAPYTGSITGLNTFGKSLIVNIGCDLSNSSQFAYTYPTFYSTLAEVYANNATLYINYAIDAHPFNGQLTLSDGTGYYQYNSTTGKLTGILDSCGIQSGYYCTALGNGSATDCEACNNSQNRSQYVYHTESVINVGTALYSNTGLTTPFGSGYNSDGTYSYSIDGSGVVASKTLCPARSYQYTINETNNCGDGTPITLYVPQNPGAPQTGLAGVTLYTDCTLTTPYTYTGPAHDSSRVYDVVGGVFTYNSACTSGLFYGTFGFSNTSGAEACSNFTTNPIGVITGYGQTLAELVIYQAGIWYASNNQNVTASYISDGVNSYQLVQNFNGNGTTGVIDPPTSC